ncbi:opioid growth factor receptor-like protein 1 isoform X1 [Dreissena polymorpha]|uniref:opioid growth factor receptor-like protein 1 isoform X1 n=1 Tax=Dreissena polymorpha TaxID=45954 RepID=UPI0022649178|nr:opioid growth factor receptor-like protein 1 isoform X1 [Dreissena polymorpha]
MQMEVDSNNSSEKETHKKGKEQVITSKSESKLKINTGKKTAEKKDSDLAKGGSLKRKHTGERMFGYSWTRQAQKDTEDYRNGYPGKSDDPEQDLNYMFYTNEIKSRPDGDYIDNIHADWWGKYNKLERHHGYIQWLFPIREQGLNWEAQELQLHEIEKINKDKKAPRRILTSYKMMLDFYGMKLDNDQDGNIVRADNWEDRFHHLNRSFHNYLRITRILKCLGEFGYERLKANFVKFVLHEGLVEETLPNLIESCMKYWIGVLKNDDERKGMFEYYEELCKKLEDKKPSPKSSKQEAKTGSPIGEKSETVKYYENELSDEEDGSLEYAVNLIDDPTNDSQMKSKSKDHELSDEEKIGEESQEIKHLNTETGSDEVNETDVVEEKLNINVAKNEVDGNDINENASGACHAIAEVKLATLQTKAIKCEMDCETLVNNLGYANKGQNVEKLHTENNAKQQQSSEMARPEVKEDAVTDIVNDQDLVKAKSRNGAEIEDTHESKNSLENGKDVGEDKKIDKEEENKCKQESAKDGEQKSENNDAEHDATVSETSNESQCSENKKTQKAEFDESSLIHKERRKETQSDKSNESKLDGEVDTSDVIMVYSDTLENQNNSANTGVETDTSASVTDIKAATKQGNSETELMEEEAAIQENLPEAMDTA